MDINELYVSFAELERRLVYLENLLKVGNVDRILKAVSSEKCKSTYNKIDLTSLFYILMDEGLLFFDPSDKKNNRLNFQSFLINNFSCAGSDGFQVEIKSISKQFSECKGFIYKEKQIRFLNNLIVILQYRKNKLENW